MIQTAIAPMLSVRKGKNAIEFYKSAFGAGELFRIESESGEVVARLSEKDQRAVIRLISSLVSVSGPRRARAS